MCVCVRVRENTFFSLFIFTVLRLWRLFYGRRRRMIIKWIREFPGHGRQEKRICSGDAYNATSSAVWCVSARCSVVFFSFLVYFSAIICLSHAARPHNIVLLLWHRAQAAMRHVWWSYFFYSFLFLRILLFALLLSSSPSSYGVIVTFIESSSASYTSILYTL